MDRMGGLWFDVQCYSVCDLLSLNSLLSPYIWLTWKVATLAWNIFYQAWPDGSRVDAWSQLEVVVREGDMKVRSVLHFVLWGSCAAC